MVIAGRDAEVGFLTTTCDGEGVILCPAGLLHFLRPFSIVVPVLKLSPRFVVVDLVDVGGGCGALGRVVVHLLQHHGVVVTIQHVVALGLPAGLYTERVVHLGCASCTTLGLDLNDAVGAAVTPDCCSSSILEHLDFLDVGRVDREQRCVGLFVGAGEVEGCIRILEDVAVDDDEGLSATVDGGDTTQTHGSAGTQVTRVGHDVKTCNLSLQGLVGCGETQTFHLTHVECLCGY